MRHYPERVLGGHTFLAPLSFTSPFVATSFLLRQGFVFAKVPDMPLSETDSVDVKFLGQDQMVEVAVRFADRFQVFLHGGGEFYTGTNLRSVLVGGSNYMYRVGGGALVRLLRNGGSGSQVSIRALGTTGSGGVLDLVRLLDAVIQRDPASVDVVVGGRLRELVLNDTSANEVSLKFLAAQALNRNFGLQAAAGASYRSFSIDVFDLAAGRELTLENDTWSPEASVAFGANLDPMLPLGFLAEYSLQVGRHHLRGSEQVDERWSHLVAIGAHIVHPQFQVGLSTARAINPEPLGRIDQMGRLRTSDAPHIQYVSLGLQFTWW